MRRDILLCEIFFLQRVDFFYQAKAPFEAIETLLAALPESLTMVKFAHKYHERGNLKCGRHCSLFLMVVFHNAKLPVVCITIF